MNLYDINVHIFRLINSLAGKNPYLDAFMIFSAQFIILAAPLALLILWFRKERKFTAFVMLDIAISLLVSIIIGHLYYIPRPFVMNLTTPLIHHAPDSSFPSEHTVIMLSLALPFFFFRRYRWGTILLLLSILVGFARIYCGVHYPFDILGSFLVSLIVTYILSVFREELFSLFSRVMRESKAS